MATWRHRCPSEHANLSELRVERCGVEATQLSQAVILKRLDQFHALRPARPVERRHAALIRAAGRLAVIGCGLVVGLVVRIVPGAPPGDRWPVSVPPRERGGWVKSLQRRAHAPAVVGTFLRPVEMQ